MHFGFGLAEITISIYIVHLLEFKHLVIMQRNIKLSSAGKFDERAIADFVIFFERQFYVNGLNSI
jgi:hypothetical protein